MINIEVIDKDLIPTRGTEGSAGFDVYLAHDATIHPNQEVKIGLGIKLELPEGSVGILVPRSSIPTEIKLANTIGIIDSDYRGEVKARVVNTGKESILLYKGDRFFQLIIINNVYTGGLNIVESVSDDTIRGEGGFGSTGQ